MLANVKLTSICGSYSLIGGVQGFGGSIYVFKTFTQLPTHNKIWLKFSLVLIDQTTGLAYRYQIKVDGVPVGSNAN